MNSIEFRKTVLAFFVELSFFVTQPELNVAGLRYSFFPVMEEVLSTSGAYRSRISCFTFGKDPPFIASQQKIEPLSGRPRTQVGGGVAFLHRGARRARRHNFFIIIFFSLEPRLMTN